MSGPVWFVTPAWRRYGLSAVCFEQRRQVIATLAERGVEAHQVIVSDDENIDLARACGFDVVEQSNRGPDGHVWLGRKFNDGFLHAARHRAEWIVPIGSDSWIDPAYFLPLPPRGFTRTSGHYCAVTAERLGELYVPGHGAGPFMFHRDLLAPSGFRPAEDSRKRSIDASTLRGIRASHRVIRWAAYDLHPFQYVGFRGSPTISPYPVLWDAFGRHEHVDWPAVLAPYYPADLIEQAQRALAPIEVAA